MDKAISYKITEHATFQYDENFFPKCLSESYIETDNLEEISKNLNISFFSADLFTCRVHTFWDDENLAFRRFYFYHRRITLPPNKNKKISEITLKQQVLILTATGRKHSLGSCMLS